MQSLNQQAFRSMAHFDSLVFLRQLCTFSGLLNCFFTLNASFVFAFLSNVGFIQASDFIKPFNSTLSECLRNPGLIYPVFFASLFANILSFPGVHSGAFNLFFDSLKGLFVSKDAGVIRALTHYQTVSKVKCFLLPDMNQLLRTAKNTESSAAALKIKLNAIFPSANGSNFSLLDWSVYMMSADKSTLSQAIIDFDLPLSAADSVCNLSPPSLVEKTVKYILNLVFFLFSQKGFITSQACGVLLSMSVSFVF